MITVETRSADETQAVAAAVSALMQPNDVLLLIGDMGAGKTTFVKGFGEAMGVQEPITSPTFVLVHSYQARLPLLHADLYRLDQLEEVEDLGIMELLEDNGVALIEWADRGLSAFPLDVLTIRCAYADETDSRRFTFEGDGPAWVGRQQALRDALQKWATT